MRRLVKGQIGLEIGGPTFLFHWWLPIYPAVGRLDNVNFSRSTIWEGEIVEGRSFVFHRRHAPGRQYILEATHLAPIPENTYDLVASSHTLEHSANPLQALAEWRRVLRPGGCVVLVVPHKEGTFDHRRPVTPLGHLIADFERRTTEDDLTHYDEIMALHDLALDSGAGSAEQFAARSKENAINRCFHHHVFDTNLVLAMVDHAGFEVLVVDPVLPFHIIVVARSEDSPNNVEVMRPNAPWRRRSPFKLDLVTRVRPSPTLPHQTD